ncbi:MAG: copper homeostasis protein CutC [Spirochaetaceae bacterium]|jgi:copper homeostasis protein|nr:copper homeostasis protein CutC [Spirochaetaceae bacterium]
MDFVKEACVETREAIAAAASGGAHRVELCSRLDLGGLTPPPDLVRYAREKNLAAAAMVRRRADFLAGTQAERAALAADAVLMLESGADALVMGFLDGGGLPDFAALDEITAAASAALAASAARAGGGAPECSVPEFVFHMAFDAIPAAAQFAALDALALRGFCRILTSGGPSGKALDNTARLKALHDYAAGRITILCGGGVTDGNYREIARRTGIREFHGRRLGLIN